MQLDSCKSYDSHLPRLDTPLCISVLFIRDTPVAAICNRLREHTVSALVVTIKFPLVTAIKYTVQA